MHTNSTEMSSSNSFLEVEGSRDHKKHKKKKRRNAENNQVGLSAASDEVQGLHLEVQSEFPSSEFRKKKKQKKDGKSIQENGCVNFGKELHKITKRKLQEHPNVEPRDNNSSQNVDQGLTEPERSNEPLKKKKKERSDQLPSSKEKHILGEESYRKHKKKKERKTITEEKSVDVFTMDTEYPSYVKYLAESDVVESSLKKKDKDGGDKLYLIEGQETVLEESHKKHKKKKKRKGELEDKKGNIREADMDTKNKERFVESGVLESPLKKKIKDKDDKSFLTELQHDVPEESHKKHKKKKKRKDELEDKKGNLKEAGMDTKNEERFVESGVLESPLKKKIKDKDDKSCLTEGQHNVPEESHKKHKKKKKRKSELEDKKGNISKSCLMEGQHDVPEESHKKRKKKKKDKINLCKVSNNDETVNLELNFDAEDEIISETAEISCSKKNEERMEKSDKSHNLNPFKDVEPNMQFSEILKRTPKKKKKKSYVRENETLIIQLDESRSRDKKSAHDNEKAIDISFPVSLHLSKKHEIGCEAGQMQTEGLKKLDRMRSSFQESVTGTVVNEGNNSTSIKHGKGGEEGDEKDCLQIFGGGIKTEADNFATPGSKVNARDVQKCDTKPISMIKSESLDYSDENEDINVDLGLDTSSSSDSEAPDLEDISKFQDVTIVGDVDVASSTVEFESPSKSIEASPHTSQPTDIFTKKLVEERKSAVQRKAMPPNILNVKSKKTVPSIPMDDLRLKWTLTAEEKEQLNNQGMPLEKGKWSKNEIQVLLDNIKHASTITGLSNEAFEKMLLDSSRDGRRERSTLGIYHILAKGINRLIKDIYAKVKRIADTDNYKGDWTKAEEKKLLELYQRYGNQWVTIGEQMGRSQFAVNHKVRRLINVKQENPTKNVFSKTAGKWQQDEEDRLMQAIANLLQNDGKNIESAGESDKGNDDPTNYSAMNWEAISMIVGTRTSESCRTKWLLDLSLRKSGERKTLPWTRQEYKALALELSNCGEKYEKNVDWGKIASNLGLAAGSVPFLKLKWKHLRGKVPGYQHVEFEEQIDWLANNYVIRIPDFHIK